MREGRKKGQDERGGERKDRMREGEKERTGMRAKKEQKE